MRARAQRLARRAPVSQPRPRRRHRGMRHHLARGVLAVLGLTALVVGGWALLAPRSFYDDFPGGGAHWIVVDGPFNEHLVRDVGGLYLALLAVTVSALLRTSTWNCRVAAAAWLTFGVPHLWYHAQHTDLLDGASAVANIVVLALGLALPASLLFAVGPEPRRISAHVSRRGRRCLPSN